jgi:thiol-disulfide isomerase/thioredoxin
MKKVLAIISFAIACFNCNIAGVQQTGSEKNDLQGEVELTIDVSNMSDTKGRFMVMVGGEIFNPEIKNNVFTVKTLMQEPRRTLLAFYTAQKIKANSGKPLNEIAAGVSDYLDFLGVPGKYKILVKGTVANSEIVNASPHQKQYTALLKLKENFDTRMADEHAALLSEIKSAQDKRVKDSLISIFYKDCREKYPKFYEDTILGFVKHNPDEPASLVELEEYSYKGNRDLKTLSFLYNNLTDRLKALPTAKRVYNGIDEESFAVNNLIGQKALDFTQNAPSGKAVSLSDFKGNVTLLEFWASWCGPCRASNPALVKAYQKYSDKGFRILGVSLDDNKERWLKAIKDDGLVWTHVSDLKEFENAAASLYHVHSIPSNFLIDKAGNIIATNLDEKELNEYLEKMCK